MTYGTTNKRLRDSGLFDPVLSTSKDLVYSTRCNMLVVFVAPCYFRVVFVAPCYFRVDNFHPTVSCSKNTVPHVVFLSASNRSYSIKYAETTAFPDAGVDVPTKKPLG